MEDKIIEHNGNKYSLKKILDSEESWQKYIKGSDRFKGLVELGVRMQLTDMELSSQKIDKYKSQNDYDK